MKLVMSAGPATQHRKTIGQFENKHHTRNWHTRQGIQQQLNKTATRNRSATPKQLSHPLATLFVAALISPAPIPASRPRQYLYPNTTTGRRYTEAAPAPAHHRRTGSIASSVRCAGAPSLHPTIAARSVSTRAMLPPKHLDNPEKIQPLHRVQRAAEKQQSAPGAAQAVLPPKAPVLPLRPGMTENQLPPLPQEFADNEPASLRTENHEVCRLLTTRNDAQEAEEAMSIKTLFEQVIGFYRQNQHADAAIACSLKRAQGQYGGNADEVMSAPVQRAIVRDWLTRNLLGDNMDSFIEKEIIQTNKISPFTNSDLNQAILRHALNEDHHIGHLAAWIWEHVLLEVMPTLTYSVAAQTSRDPDAERFDAMEISEFGWGQIYAGLRFAHSSGLDIRDIPIAAAADVGILLLTLLKAGRAPSEWWIFFRLPALIRFAQVHPERISGTRGVIEEVMQAHALQNYITDHDTFLQENCAWTKFDALMHDYQTRPQLAQKIIDEKCHGLAVNDYLNKKTYTCLLGKEVDTLLKLDKFKVVQADDQPSYLPNIDEQFSAHITPIAKAYALLEKLLLIATTNLLPEQELSFIASAQVHMAQAIFKKASSDSLGKIFRDFLAPLVLPVSIAELAAPEIALNHVKFFSASRIGQATRIYVLVKDSQRYELRRIDRERAQYLALLRTQKITVPDDFQLFVDEVGFAIKRQKESLNVFFDGFQQRVQSDFDKSLHDSGYQETTQEKVTQVLVSLIPFYSCANSVKNGERAMVLLNCGLDLMTFTPLVGQLGRLSGHLLEVITHGGLLAARSATVEMATHQSLRSAIATGASEFIQYAILPAQASIDKQSLKELGLAAIRALDPGIEASAMIGAASIKQATQLGKYLAKNLPHLAKPVSKLETQMQKMSGHIAHDHIVTARLHGLDHPIEVARLGGDQYQGQQVYVRIHRETGEPFGRKYLLTKEHLLTPIPESASRRLHNILEQGLSGKGALAAAEDWSQGRKEMTASLLRQIQNKIASGEQLNQLAVQYGFTAEVLRRYLSDTGKLTSHGQELVDAAEAGPSRNSVAAHALSPTGLLSPPLSQIAPDRTVKQLYYNDRGKIIPYDNTYGDSFKYDIDRDAFFSDENQYANDAFVVQNGQLVRTSIPGKQSPASISLAQRTTVIKALGIDLDLVELSRLDPASGVLRKPIPKTLSFIWVGPCEISANTLKKIEINSAIAMSRGYNVHFYLSDESEEANKKALEKIASATKNSSSRNLKFHLHRLEETDVYKNFQRHLSFPQYREAITGNGGKATNYASACDIFRFFLINEKGGLYSDVDDLFTRHFGETELFAADREFVLGAPLSAEGFNMYQQFGTSFFGSHAGNPINEEVLAEMRDRFAALPMRTFYQAQRPKASKKMALEINKNVLREDAAELAKQREDLLARQKDMLAEQQDMRHQQEVLKNEQQELANHPAALNNNLLRLWKNQNALWSMNEVLQNTANSLSRNEEGILANQTAMRDVQEQILAYRIAMKKYQETLFFLTGPDVFNTVLHRSLPMTKYYTELRKLWDISKNPDDSALLADLKKRLPAMTPLGNWHTPGSLNSWREARR